MKQFEERCYSKKIILRDFIYLTMQFNTNFYRHVDIIKIFLKLLGYLKTLHFFKLY